MHHIGLLFSQLPIKYQPKQILDQPQESFKSNGATTDNAYLTNASRVEKKDYYSNFADLPPPPFSFKPYTPFDSIGYRISFEGSTSQLDDDTKYWGIPPSVFESIIMNGEKQHHVYKFSSSATSLEGTQLA